MQVKISTGPNIDVDDAFAAQVNGALDGAIGRFSDRITRVEVHLSDQNSDKKVGVDAMRCMMEARLEGRQPIAVTHQTTALYDAVHGAADKLAAVIEKTLDRQRRQERHRTDPDPSAPEPEVDEES